ncbi:CLEC16A/TT9, N-terminal [Dillenia turbinata]|uniref:CLEC16A/TT9, N-terminal n=1 Tax=Dillenia turbinata TaxID=194707 RepID=A0AAN8W6I5_9MAGN
MWRSLWRSVDRFSLQYFKYIINELRKINVVDKLNKEFVVDILQSIVEIVTYGDKHDSSIFECFMEYQVLAEFVRVLKISKDSKIEAPLLQYLSIMIQNMDNYCFSNEYVNSIISHQFEFEGGDLAPYYISFLRAVSCKLNRDTLCLFVKVQEDTVVSFPLYSEALKFAQHGEKMIQTAVRALTLNVYNVSDDMVFQYLTTPPASKYFLDLVLSMREQCIHLDGLVQATKELGARERRKELVLETDKFVDDLYYLKDILSVGDSRLSRLVLQNLFSLLVFPILFPLLQLGENDGPTLSVVTSLYIVSHLLQIVDDKDMVNSVASFILYPYTISNFGITGKEKRAEGASQTENLVNHFNKGEELVCTGPESEIAEKMDISCLFEHLRELMSSISQPFSNTSGNIQTERGGIDLYLFTDNHSQLLAALYLFIVLAESKDLDPLLTLVIGLSQNINMQKEVMLSNGSLSHIVDGSIFLRHFPQILNGLFKILSYKQPFPVVTQWHTGWFLQKLLVFQERRLVDLDFQSFNVWI